MPNDPEIGEELQPSQLEVNTVVVMKAEHRSEFITAWVMERGIDFVAMSMEVIRTTLILKIRPDGTAVDELQRPIRFYRYLGEI